MANTALVLRGVAELTRPDAPPEIPALRDVIGSSICNHFNEPECTPEDATRRVAGQEILPRFKAPLTVIPSPVSPDLLRQHRASEDNLRNMGLMDSNNAVVVTCMQRRSTLQKHDCSHDPELPPCTTVMHPKTQAARVYTTNPPPPPAPRESERYTTCDVCY
ncbi:hypothetical protein VTJ04DRAFT_3585 [Mycothermus thermophilus]|uniref:uncharacterized protein n=1 Tax=Humicola insolens TaxID=85995 RepID=UPI003743BA3F